jgi:hypothetical protein
MLDSRREPLRTTGRAISAGSLERRRTRSFATDLPLEKSGSLILKAKLAERTGLEPATPGVTGRYSNQLNYRSNFCWVLKVFHTSDPRPFRAIPSRLAGWPGPEGRGVYQRIRNVQDR